MAVHPFVVLARDMASRTLDRIGRAVGGLARKLAILSAAGAGLAVLTQAAGALAVQALALVSALAPAVGVVALLPAVGVAAAAAFGLLKVATIGFGDAVKAAFSGDADKFAETLEKLSPAARSVAREFQAVAPGLKAFQRALQDNLFKHLKGQVEATGKALAGLAKNKAFIHITSLFGFAAARALEFARSGETLSRLTEITENLGAALKPLAGAVRPLLDALMRIATVGSAFFPGLTGGATQAAQAFAKWAKEAEKNGQLQEIISSALNVLGELGKIAINVGSILRSVFQAGEAAGGGLLNNLVQITGVAAKFLNSFEGQTALDGFFSSAGRVISSLMPIVQTVASAIGSTVAPMIADLAEAFTPGLAALIEGLAAGLAALAPAASPVGAALGAVAAAAAPLLEVLGSALGGLLTVLAVNLQGLATGLAPVIALFADGFTSAMRQLLPLLTAMATDSMPHIVAAGQAFTDAFAPALPLITQIAQVLAGELAAALPQIAATLRQVVPHMVALAQQGARNLLTALQALVPHIPALAGAFVQWAGAIAQTMAAIMPEVLNVFTTLLAQMTPHLPVLITAFVQLAQAAAQIAVALAPLIAKFGVAIAQFIAGAVGSRQFGALLTLVIGVVVRAVGAFTTFANIITAVAGWLQSLSSRASAVAGSVGGALSGMASRVTGLFSGMWASARNATSSGVSSVVSYARSLPGRIVGAVGSLGGLLVGAGQSLIQGLISGIQSMIGALQSQLASVTSMLPNWKGPMSKDLKLLQPSGQAIMSGLMSGIGGQVPALQAQLSGITAAIPAMGGLGRSGGHAERLGAAGAGRTYSITVQVPPTANPAEVGGHVVEAIKQYEIFNGAAWRSG